MGLLALAVLTLALTAWGVGGSMSEYYASIALSMSKSWPNFFFGAVDPAGTVTLDKIPGSFWIPALSARLFGFSPAAVILPNALAAAAATVITAIAARRWAGRTAGIVAGLVVATTPILVAVARSNQPETFFMLALALTAWAATKALERRSLGWLVLAGVFHRRGLPDLHARILGGLAGARGRLPLHAAVVAAPTRPRRDRRSDEPRALARLDHRGGPHPGIPAP